MYAVTAFGSWTAVEQRRVAAHGTYDFRGDAIAARDALAYPIVDVRDIGAAGSCPARSPRPLGHRFDVQRDPVECLDCGAWMDDLYIPGTYWPAEAVPIEPDPIAIM